MRRLPRALSLRVGITVSLSFKQTCSLADMYDFHTHTITEHPFISFPERESRERIKLFLSVISATFQHFSHLSSVLHLFKVIDFFILSRFHNLNSLQHLLCVRLNAPKNLYLFVSVLLHLHSNLDNTHMSMLCYFVIQCHYFLIRCLAFSFNHHFFTSIFALNQSTLDDVYLLNLLVGWIGYAEVKLLEEIALFGSMGVERSIIYLLLFLGFVLIFVGPISLATNPADGKSSRRLN